jgi:photosystem II stability/assembly factor-like uncharacterized protein
MSYKITRISWFGPTLFVLFVLLSSSVFAQVEGFTETFDNPALPGWEHSPNAEVVDGVLWIEGSGYAMHPGEWGNFSLSVIAKLTGEGTVTVSYRVGEEAEYSLIIGTEEAILSRAGESLDHEPIPPVPPEDWFVIEIVVTDNSHEIILNGQPILFLNDPQPLPPGGVSLAVNGNATGIFDDLKVMPIGESLPTESPKTEIITPTEQPTIAVPTQVVSESPSTSGFNWIRTGGPPGGLGYDIRYDFDNPDVWYVTDNFSGVHKSTDGGLTWHPINNGIPAQTGPTGDFIPVFCLTVDPHNTQILWAGSDRTGHIYKSIDGGEKWVQMDNGVAIDYDALTFRGFTVDPRSSDIVYAMSETIYEAGGGPGIWGQGNGGVVYKTSDGGLNWESIWDGGMPSALARYMFIHPENPDILYVSTGIFDRGAEGEGDPLTDPFGGIGILKSTDGGETWEIQNEENGLRMLYLGSLYMHPEIPDILLTAAGHTLEGDASEYMQNLTETETNPAGVYRTENGGETWTQVLVPNHFAEFITSVEYCPEEPDIAYAGGPFTIYRSEDAGITWEMVSGGAEGWGPSGVMAGSPIDLQCDPKDSDRIFANNYAGGNFLSEDGGVSWVNASNGYTGSQIVQIVVDPSDPSTVYAVGRSGMWRSDDGGSSWYGLRYSPKEWGLPTESYAIETDPSKSGHILLGGAWGASIFESFDGGYSWDYRWPGLVNGEPPVGIAGDVTDIAYAPSDSDIVYAGIGRACVLRHEPCLDGLGVVISRDGGATWNRSMDTTISDVPVMDMAVHPNDPQIVYAAGEDGLYKSTDGGVAWQKLEGIPAGEGYNKGVRAVTVDHSDPQHILACVGGLGAYRSDDGGITWQQSIGGLEANTSCSDILFDPSNAQIAYLSDYLSGVYRSENGGSTWVKINDGLRTRSLYDLSFSGDGKHLYLGTNGEGVYRLDLTSPLQTEESTAPQSPTEETSLTQIQVIGIGVILLGIGLVTVIILARRKSSGR